ncbi:hypothetical protein [Geodermatophilus sp. DSM 44513]|uniref:hypothetical protein n=1 Tax=Geodermatophilus sp. DSM 44513 TaxID=1528104 RepID=UPI0012756BD7|nr:hypothetical protein [Geodermatophilus sp. DSM 44513]WNV75205.1 hypothetical protein RTG05_19805 [Geodermatophilus sp. DSM 44513]
MAVVATTLTLLVAARTPEMGGATGDGGVAGMVALDADARAAATSQLAGAVGWTYAVPLVLMGLSAVAAVVGLRRRAPSPDEPARAEATS